MQRKKLLSACIAIALSSPAWAAGNVDDTRQQPQVGCPVDLDKISASEREKLPAECRNNVVIPWVAVGVTSLATVLAVNKLSNDNNSHHGATPPDDVIPPDDGDDVIPPDDGGDVTPPDDGGDVTPPAPLVKFNNNVIWDQNKETLTIRNVVFTYGQNPDGSYTLTAPDGKTTLVTSWQIDKANNTIQLNGVNITGNVSWFYDDDGLLYATKKNGVVIDDKAGTLAIRINDAVITDQGGNTALNGATVMDVTGNNIVINNDGDSIATGAGSIVAVLTGNNITINNNGNITVDGGTASVINGDHATLNNHGDVAITGGGSGARIMGDFAAIDNIGDITVDGPQSVSTQITGNDAVVKQEGDLSVSGGAHGIEVVGKGAKITNRGKISVTDTDSIGLLVTGDNASFISEGDIDVSNSGVGVSITGNAGDISLAGNMQVGDFASGLSVSGNNNRLTLATDELNVTGQKASGVNVYGDNNTIAVSGNILVDKDQTADDAVDYFFDPSTGVYVSGDNNSVTLDGLLTVVADSEVTTRQVGTTDGSQETITGLAVSGDGNTVTLNGGIQLKGEAGKLTDGSAVAAKRVSYGQASIVQIDGHSTVYLNGDSSVSGDFPVGYAGIIQLNNGGKLEIGDGATFNSQGVNSFEHFGTTTPSIVSVRSGSQVINNGDIDISNMSFATIDGENTTGINNGSIVISQNTQDPAPSPAGFLSVNGGSATNTGTITGKVMEQNSVFNKFSTGSSNWFIFNNDVSSITGMVAYTKSAASNSENGAIDMYGRGVVGMLALNGATAQNAGDITLDTLWVDENDTTQLRDGLASKDAIDYGVGMAVGTDGYSGTGTNATAINQQGGEITIYNAGAGMAAYGASNIVINQGTINLEANENADDSLGAGKLVGMAVYKGGTAINDQTGVININAENGQAFYNDGTGTILNYGEINLNGSPIDESDSHMGATSENLDWLAHLAGSGETETQTATRDGFFIARVLANYGNETLNGDVNSNYWLYNEALANLTINGKLSVTQGLENS